jgi:hypothetical protein
LVGLRAEPTATAQRGEQPGPLDHRLVVDRPEETEHRSDAVPTAQLPRVGRRVRPQELPQQLGLARDRRAAEFEARTRGVGVQPQRQDPRHRPCSAPGRGERSWQTARELSERVGREQRRRIELPGEELEGRSLGEAATAAMQSQLAALAEQVHRREAILMAEQLPHHEALAGRVLARHDQLLAHREE